MSIFEQRLSFECCKMQVGVSGFCNLCKESQQSLGGYSGGKALEKYCLFTFGEQINSSKIKKPTKQIYFECKFNAKML